MVNQSFVRRYLPGEDPLGVRLDFGSTVYFRVASLNHSGALNFAQAGRVNLQIWVSSDALSFGQIDAAVARSPVR